MMSKNLARILLLLTLLHSIHSVFSIDFLFNGFNSSDISLYGNATIESRIVTLTNDTTFSIGRALYPSKIPTKTPNSSHVLPFSTSFIFAMAPYKGKQQGHGIVFLFVPHTGIADATSSQNLGFLNRTYIDNEDTHVFGVEFDVFKNEEFDDISDNHVGIDVNSLTSENASEAGYWPDDDQESFKKLKLNNGKNYQVWIDYADFEINVTMIIAGEEKPKKALISAFVNLSHVFEDEMYVGFTASTGALVQSHKILAWSYSNDDFSLSKNLITSNLPSFELPKDPIYKSKWFVAGMIAGSFCVVVIVGVVSLLFVNRYKRLKREKDEMEDWELEYWPHKIPYQDIETATKNFSDENVIGIGGNGKVYKGVLAGGVEVAVKRISHDNGEGMREFVSEISSLGRLKQRNLVGLRGWCKKERGSLILIYDYMENGSLDKMVFESDGVGEVLSCKERIRILNEVASALLYLHEGWESKVLHRDIKSSNVLLDKDMIARLGDFGLARMHDHSVMATTTRVVGTAGYLAPEVVRTGRASTQTDVFSYGVLILEVMCGRRPIEEGKPLLVDYIFELLRQDRLVDAVDERLRAKGGFDEDEVNNLLHLGLLCAHPDPSSRPTMRQVVKFFEGNTEIEESDGEDMNKYFLEKFKANELWSSSSHSFSNGSHPTFEELREGLSSSMSLSWSTNVEVGNRKFGKHCGDTIAACSGYVRSNVVIILGDIGGVYDWCEVMYQYHVKLCAVAWPCTY
ncbi:hypothetical protein LIER_15155 [Lithospermum erythrorhizon]|uniref:non-specific serine/threonine protein kinase n=1 Tax=Lithospermum erythrorhizon TaxID=34254 RepID=A0AAV3Q4B0_LITER